MTLVASSACGGADSSDEVRTDPETAGSPEIDTLVGSEVSSVHTSRLVAFDGGAALIDSAATDDHGQHRLIATWNSDDGQNDTMDAGRPALAHPKAWGVGASIYVYGRECPDIDVGLVSDIDQVPIADVCGDHPTPYVLRRLDTTTGEWTVVVDALPKGPGGYGSVLDIAGETAVARTDDGALFSIDLDSGDVENLSGPSLAQATVGTTCPVADGILLVSTSAPIGQTGLVPGEGELTLWLVRGTTATEVEVSPREGLQSFAPMGCLVGRGVFGLPDPVRNAVDLLTIDNGLEPAILDTLTLPDAAAGVNGVRLESAGTSLLAWVPDGDGLIPWGHNEAEWLEAGQRIPDLDAPRQVLATSDTTLSLIAEYGEDGGQRAVVGEL